MDVMKATVVIMAMDERIAQIFAQTLKNSIVDKYRTNSIRPSNYLRVAPLYTPIKDIKEVMARDDATIDDFFEEDDIKIFAAIDQPANELLEEIEEMLSAETRQNNPPTICRMDEAVIEYCRAREIKRLWLHNSDIGAAYADMAWRLSKSDIMPVKASLKIDREIQRIIAEAAAACRLNAPQKQELSDRLQRALEFFTQQLGTQYMLVDHWAWPFLINLPSNAVSPRLLSSAKIYLDKISDMILSGANCAAR